MISQHNIQYSCNGFGSHEPEIFFYRTEFEEHLTELHPRIFSGPEISTLADISAQPSSIVFDNGPFCNFSIGGKDKQTPPLNDTMQEWQMQKHILDHLLSLFLMALPERDDLPEASSSKSRSRVNEQSVQSLDVKNLDVGSEDYLDEDYANVVFEAVPNDETQEDWGFLPPYEYGDPDTDSILDHFKPHLQASFVLDPLLEIMPQNDVEIMESEDIIELREAMNAIPDEFGFIHDAVLVWDAHMKTQHRQNELARQKRQHAEQNRIRFFSRKKEFERTEVSRKFEETRSEYETFVKEVFDLVWKK